MNRTATTTQKLQFKIDNTISSLPTQFRCGDQAVENVGSRLLFSEIQCHLLGVENFEAIIRNSQRHFLLNSLTLTGPGGFRLAVALLAVICHQLRSVRWRRNDPEYRSFVRETGK